MIDDAWGDCPKCKKEMNARIKNAYGAVSEKEFVQLLKQRVNREDTLYEDYEIYMNDEGVFEINYRCECDACGFEYQYIYKEKVEVK